MIDHQYPGRFIGWVSWMLRGFRWRARRSSPSVRPPDLYPKIRSKNDAGIDMDWRLGRTGRMWTKGFSKTGIVYSVWQLAIAL